MEDSRSWFPLLKCGRIGFSSTVNSPSRRVERRSRVQIADCLRWAGGDEERRKEGECILKSQRRKGWGARSLAIRSGRLIFLTQSTRTDLSAVFGRRNGLAVSRRGAGRSPGAGPGGVPRSSFVWLPEGAGRGRRRCRHFLAGARRGELAELKGRIGIWRERGKESWPREQKAVAERGSPRTAPRNGGYAFRVVVAVLRRMGFKTYSCLFTKSTLLILLAAHFEFPTPRTLFGVIRPSLLPPFPSTPLRVLSRFPPSQSLV